MSEDPTGSALGGSTGEGVAGGASGTGVSGGTGGLPGVAVNGGASALTRMVRGTLPEHGHVSPSTGGEIDYLRTAWGTDHLDPLTEPDPHGQYLLESDADATYATDADVLAQLAAHVAAADPHAGYLTPERGDDLFLTDAEGDLEYAAVDHTHPSEVTGDWYYAPSTVVSGDPGNGNFRANTAPLASATTLDASRTNNDGYQVTVFDALQTDDSIYLQDKNDNTRWVRFRITATPTRTASYSLLPVALVTSSGVAIASAQLCTAIFTVGAGGGGGGAGGVMATDALWDAKGDLAAGTGPNAATRLGAGTNGQVLAANSAAATGLEWVSRAHDHTAADGSGVLSNEEHDGYSQYANLGADPATPTTNRIRLYSKDNGSGIATLYYRTEDGTIYEMPTLTTGGNGSGAPSNASYITTASENKLSGERVLGTAVVMTGTLASRPAAGTAGRLYLASDNDLAYRDNGSAWDVFATRHAQGHNLFSTDHPDVNAADAPADGDVLTYSSGSGKWAGAAPAGGGGGSGLPTTGGTMTGTIVADGTASGVSSGGALRVTGATAPTSDARVYGASSPTYTANSLLTAGREYGVSFSSSSAVYLVAVRWYRLNAGASPPTAVRLWDSTSTASPVLTVSALSGFADTAAGWKEQRLPAGTQPLLVAGRTYVLSHTAVGSTSNGASAYTPVPDSPVTWIANVNTTTGGAYPTTSTAVGYAMDGGFRATLSAPTPAQSGPLRLANDVAGAIRWRDSVDGSDLSLMMDSGDRLALTVGATAVTTSASGGSATAPPAQPVAYLTVMVNGNARKLALYG